MNIRKIFLAILLVLIACSTIIYAKLPQPVEFNHNIHVIEVEMDCSDCHRYVITDRKATLPDKDVCSECHSEIIGESVEEQKLIALLESEREFNWQRVYVLPKHVYFSHFRHVTLGQVSCQECHGEMKELTSPPDKPAVDINDMDNCMNCHEDRQVNNDCLTCHT
ncbi:MAG: cytochrome c3 family protein [candidate division Zixibacteria bacterium]